MILSWRSRGVEGESFETNPAAAENVNMWGCRLERKAFHALYGRAMWCVVWQSGNMWGRAECVWQCDNVAVENCMEEQSVLWQCGNVAKLWYIVRKSNLALLQTVRKRRVCCGVISTLSQRSSSFRQIGATFEFQQQQLRPWSHVHGADDEHICREKHI